MASLTVMLMPWILGGTIPQARFVLQLGASLALGLSLVSLTISGGLQRGLLPRLVVPLLGFGCLGILHLLPISGDPLAAMDHAVLPQYRVALPDVPATSMPRSVSPGDTRLVVAQVAALAALLLVAFDQVRTRQRLTTCLALQVANAAALTIVAIIQKLRDGNIVFGEMWVRTLTPGFAGFVNPNHAAGWLCAQLASVTALFMLMRHHRVPGSVRGFHRPKTMGERIRRVLLHLRFHLAVTDTRTVMVALAAGLIVSGIALTLSRGGILATVGCIAITALIVLRLRPVMVVVMVVVLLAAGAAFVTFLGFDQAVVAEMETLSDPFEAGAVRLRHWRDSLALLRDFPVIGGGLGTWQFVTLPYQTQDLHVWFRHADNHFVELVVESGLLGMVLILTALVQTVQIQRRLSQSAWSTDTVHANYFHGLLIWFSLLVFGQLICAGFDFGIGMCAASSLVALSLGGCLGGAGRGVVRRSSEELPGVWNVGDVAGMAARIGVVVAAAAFLPDLFRCQAIYQEVIPAGRLAMLRTPDQDDLRQNLPGIRERLGDAVRHRPDDSEGQMMQAFLAEVSFRSALLGYIPGIQDSDDDAFADAWQQTALPEVARLLAVQKSSSPDEYRETVASVRAELESSGLSVLQTRAMAELRLAPMIPARIAYVASIEGETIDFEMAARRCVFPDSAASSTFYNLGQLFLLSGRWEEAREYWRLSLNAASTWRPEILFAAVTQMELRQAMEAFGPRTYRDAVECLRRIPAGDLRNEILAAADQFWVSEGHSVPTLSLWRLRDEHLTTAGRPQDALEWALSGIRAGLYQPVIYVRAAQLLEQSGKKTEARQHWQHVQSLDPGNLEAESAIRRLSDD